MGETTRQVGTAVFWSVLARSGRFVLGMASSVIVVRSLGEHDYGVLSVVRTLLAFVVVVASVGLGQSLLKFLPVLRVERNRRGARRLVARVFLVQMGVWAILLAASFLLAGAVQSLFRIEGLGLILSIAISLCIFELFTNLMGQVLNAHYDTKMLSISQVTSQAVMIVFLLILLPAGWGVPGVFVAAAAGNIVASLILLRKVTGLFAGAEGSAEGVGISRGRLLRFSLPFALIGLLIVIVWRQSETLFLAHFWGPATTGFFDLAYRIPQTVLEFVPGAVWPIIMAGFSEAYASNRDNLKLAVDRYYRMLFLLSTPICIFGLTMGGRMVPILFGEAMSPASVPTQCFFAIFTVSFFATPLSMALYVLEKSHLNLLVYLGLAIVNVGLDLVLIPRYGITGAMIPVGLVIFASPFIYKRVLGRFVDGVTIPFRFIARCFLASSPILLMLPLTGLVRGVPELVAAFAVAVGIVLVMVKKLRLIGKEESDMLGSIPIPAAHRLLKYMST